MIPEAEKGYSIWPENEAELRRKWNSPGLAYVGDKAPFYIRQLPHLRDTFPGCKLVVLLRDPVSVADSYERRAEDPDDHWPSENDHKVAIEHWNQSIEDLNDYLVRFGLQDLFIVDYQTFYSGDQTYLRSLYRFLELDTSQFVERQFIEATRDSDRRSAPAPSEPRGRNGRSNPSRLGRLPAAEATHPVDADYRVLAADQENRSALETRVDALEAAYRRLFGMSRELHAEGKFSEGDSDIEATWRNFWRLPELEPDEPSKEA